MAKIKSISEAYSMQPSFRKVCDLPFDNFVHKKHSKECIAEITEEHENLTPDKIIYFYIGRNFDAEVLFKYLSDSVNVEYYPE
jgi:hypothetical protein